MKKLILFLLLFVKGFLTAQLIDSDSIKVSEKLGMKPIFWNEGSKSSSSDLIEDRPILNDLMFKINNGEVQNLWVFNNDRLSRNENVWWGYFKSTN